MRVGCAGPRSPSSPPRYLLNGARRLGNGAVGADESLGRGTAAVAAVAVPVLRVVRVAPLHGRSLRYLGGSRRQPGGGG